MEFIKNTSEERILCNNYEKKNRSNSEFKDYLNKIYKKPWGKEYLSYQTKEIGIWILHVDKGKETSVHCHFKKDTLLVCLNGCFKINLFEGFKILNTLEMLYIPKDTFHGIYSYTDNAILMEIEIYTNKVSYSDKNDLLRLRDVYVRDKDKYESSVTEIEDTNEENMIFNKEIDYKIDKTEITVKQINKEDDMVFMKNNSINILLSGCLFINGTKVSEGSLLKYNNKISMLSKSINILAINNIYFENLSKIIYNTDHLKDYLKLNNLKNVGLTSGCFDILHEGHINNLKLSKQNCDILLVCLSSDEQIKRIKGEARPINNLSDRISMLLNYNFIDIIILYEESNDQLESELDNIINMVNPDIWFKGGDYNKTDIISKHPGLKKIILHKLIQGKSTTNLINKINNNL
jgi:D-glycero-beta-D-manno-heptose 1-phosphate adenylyltransferase